MLAGIRTLYSPGTRSQQPSRPSEPCLVGPSGPVPARPFALHRVGPSGPVRWLVGPSGPVPARFRRAFCPPQACSGRAFGARSRQDFHAILRRVQPPAADPFHLAVGPSPPRQARSRTFYFPAVNVVHGRQRGNSRRSVSSPGIPLPVAIKERPLRYTDALVVCLASFAVSAGCVEMSALLSI